MAWYGIGEAPFVRYGKNKNGETIPALLCYHTFPILTSFFFVPARRRQSRAQGGQERGPPHIE
jgi:hypothetical protein